jgi:hypothetical protein
MASEDRSIESAWADTLQVFMGFVAGASADASMAAAGVITDTVTRVSVIVVVGFVTTMIGVILARWLVAPPPSMERVRVMVYHASFERTYMAQALDMLTAYVTYWLRRDPRRVAALFDELDPTRLAACVGQTILALTRGTRAAASDPDLYVARSEYVVKHIKAYPERADRDYG